MSDLLIVVESPAKIETIRKYLGSKYILVATFGHIKDLPIKKMGIDFNKNFAPQYVIISGKKKIVENLKMVSKDIDNIYLAPDPDREGEAISWHVSEILDNYNKTFYRVLFNELTKNSVFTAVSNPNKLDRSKYKAQQSRRILDRIVGYEMSSLLWNKVKRGISAGRVQSVSVRVICEREKKIFIYKPKEYWSIFAQLKASSPSIFTTMLRYINGKVFFLYNKGLVSKIKEELSYNDFFVHNIKEKLRKISSKPPFITSTLQQEAIKKLNFSAKKAMIIAQQLYEGLDVGNNNQIGLITYMRTDSTRLSEYAIRDSLNFIGLYFGRKFVPKKLKLFKHKGRVQDAHEAIRPTYVLNTPERVKPYLSYDQIKLYTIIWDRVIASQIEKSIISYVRIDINSKEYTFTLGETKNNFLGFKIIYEYKKKSVFNDAILPFFKLGDLLKLRKMGLKQYFTAPPYRFSEDSLVKELEENGIGRPSTYATIIANIQNKGYVNIVKKSCRPTELGFIVNELLISAFPEVMNVEFTAKMEYKLDKIEHAEINNIRLLNDFYFKFNKKLRIAKRSLLNVSGVGVATNISCPDCTEKQLRIKMGKGGHFISCSRYPRCTFSSNYTRDGNGNITLFKIKKDLSSSKICITCHSSMIVKYGKYGKFLACRNFPKCKNTVSINVFGKTETVCPKKGCFGKVMQKFSKKGRLFYGCEHFPSCDFASWDKPINVECEKCDSTYLVEKIFKKKKRIKVCPNFNCNYMLKV